MEVIDYSDKVVFEYPKNPKNCSILLTKNEKYIYIDNFITKGWYKIDLAKKIEDTKEDVIEDIPDYKITKEYKNMRGLNMVNAIEAYKKGATGKNILVGIVDTGVHHNHDEFNGKILKGIDFSNNRFLNTHYHGSHVAGIVGAKRAKNNNRKNMHGYAFDCKLIDFRIFNKNGAMVMKDKDSLEINEVVTDNKVKILNRSYGLVGWFADGYKYSVRNYKYWYSNTFKSYLDMVKDETIQVWAGGNDGYKELGVESALGTVFPELRKIWSSAVSVDANGYESFYSCRAGKVCALNTLTTFGGGANDGGVNSTGNKNNYISSMGTSMAAPALAGCLAIVMDRFKNKLSNYECLIRLFTTASYEKLHVGFHKIRSGSRDKILKLLDNYSKNPNLNRFIEIKKLILGNNFEKNIPNTSGGKIYPASKKFDYYISAKIILEKLNKPYKGWKDYTENPAKYILFAIFGYGFVDLEKATKDITNLELEKIKKFDSLRVEEIERLSTKIHRKFKHLIYKKPKISDIKLI